MNQRLKVLKFQYRGIDTKNKTSTQLLASLRGMLMRARFGDVTARARSYITQVCKL